MCTVSWVLDLEYLLACIGSVCCITTCRLEIVCTCLSCCGYWINPLNFKTSHLLQNVDKLCKTKLQKTEHLTDVYELMKMCKIVCVHFWWSVLVESVTVRRWFRVLYSHGYWYTLLLKQVCLYIFANYSQCLHCVCVCERAVSVTITNNESTVNQCLQEWMQ